MGYNILTLKQINRWIIHSNILNGFRNNWTHKKSLLKVIRQNLLCNYVKTIIKFSISTLKARFNAIL